MKTNKGILIDAKNKTVSVVEVGDFRDMQAKIGCGCFTTGGGLDNGDTLYVDDEGLINGTQDFFWNPAFMPNPLAGNGLLLACDEEGESADASSTAKEIADGMRFMDVHTIRSVYGV